MLTFDFYRDSKTWSTGGIEGVHRFLARTWRLIVGPPLPDGSYICGTIATDDEPTLDQLRSLHRCIAKVRFFLQLQGHTIKQQFIMIKFSLLMGQPWFHIYILQIAWLELLSFAYPRVLFSVVHTKKDRKNRFFLIVYHLILPFAGIRRNSRNKIQHRNFCNDGVCKCCL